MALKALIVNCTLKHSGKTSNTQALIDKAARLLHELGVETETIRFVDYTVKVGISADEGQGDEWPAIVEKIRAADIFIVGSPVWVAHLASTAQHMLERMNAFYSDKQFKNELTGQFFTYNKVAGAICTGDEDGAQTVISHVLWALQDMGFTVPPNASTYWVGEAGPGPSFIEAGGDKSPYTNKTLRFMVHNLVYFAKLLKQHPIPTNLEALAEEAEKAD